MLILFSFYGSTGMWLPLLAVPPVGLNPLETAETNGKECF